MFIKRRIALIHTLYLESCSSTKTDGVMLESTSSNPQSESDFPRFDLSNWTHIWTDSHSFARQHLFWGVRFGIRICAHHDTLRHMQVCNVTLG